MTNFHVVDGASGVTVQFPDQRTAPARVVRTDRRRDLALLAVETKEVPVPLGETEGLQPGGPLLAVGYPRPDALGARSATVTRGAFSGLWRAPEDVWFVQTDAAVNPGNSGGPLVDAQGRVVGIVTARVAGAEGLNLAVAANEVRVFLASTDNPPPPPPAPTVTPRLPTPPAPEQPAAESFWTVCVWCDWGTHDPRSQADDAARQLRAAGLPAGVLWSSDYPSLRPGYWITYSGRFSSEQAAVAHRVAVEHAGLQGQVRLIGR